MQAATPGCTKEACSFRDSYGKFKDAGAEVFGISADTVEANSDFAKVFADGLYLGWKPICAHACNIL